MIWESMLCVEYAMATRNRYSHAPVRRSSVSSVASPIDALLTFLAFSFTFRPFLTLVSWKEGVLSATAVAASGNRSGDGEFLLLVLRAVKAVAF